jgi:hypothetical protein
VLQRGVAPAGRDQQAGVTKSLIRNHQMMVVLDDDDDACQIKNMGEVLVQYCLGSHGSASTQMFS